MITNTLAYSCTKTFTAVKSFIKQASAASGQLRHNDDHVDDGANSIKLFIIIIYCYSMVILSFCVTMLFYLGKYHGVAVYYNGKKLYKIAHGGKFKYCGNLQ